MCSTNSSRPALAFVLLGLVALATLAAALVHGPALGGLGLVGAYVTPLLVSTTQPSYWALYVYLAVVTAAAYALARFRTWRWLAITAAAFSMPGCSSAWAICVPDRCRRMPSRRWRASRSRPPSWCPGLFYGPHRDARPDRTGLLRRAGGLPRRRLCAGARDHPRQHALITLFVLAAATAAIAWRSEAAIAAVPVAAVLAVARHRALGGELQFRDPVTPSGPFYGAPPTWTIVGRGQHLLFAAGTAAVFGAAGYWAKAAPRGWNSSMLWAACAVLTPIAHPDRALLQPRRAIGRSIPFALWRWRSPRYSRCAALRSGKREPRPGMREASAIFATGAVAALALALTFALEKGWLTVALALMVPGIA